MLAVGAVLMLSGHSQARGYYQLGDVNVEIVSDQRGLLPVFAAGADRVQGEWRYIIGRDNERYRIRISNQSNERVGVIIAVDGRNIISGARSYLQSYERMYVLGPYQTHEYDGWGGIKNQGNNRFHFAGRNEYASMGVAEVAVFRDRHHQRYQKNHGKGWRADRGMHGPRFAAQKRPFETRLIRYEDRATLCRMGLIQCEPRQERKHVRQHNNRNRGFSQFPAWHFRLRF